MKLFSFLPLFLILFLFAGCSAINSSPKEERAKTEMALRKMRTDLDEVKHDLNSNQMELHILEGKVLNQDTSLASLKEQTLDQQQAKIHSAVSLLSGLEKKTSHLEKKIDDALSDIRKLTLHANETTTALTQYQDKINEVEKHIVQQNLKLGEVSAIKNTIKELLKSTTQTFTYTVKNGDTLERIAKTYSTSVETLKRINKVQDDVIYPGQELLIPTSS